MTLRIITWLTVLGCSLLAGSAWAYDCSGLPEWKRQHYYLEGAQVQYQGTAYENTAESSKRDFPDRSANWLELGACGSSGGGDDGGGGGDSGGDPVTPEPLSIFGAWHCGDDYCTWSTVRGMAEFDEQNNWLIDGGNGLPSVNLVVLSFVHPLQLLNGTEPTHDGPDVVGCQPCGMPVGMNQAVVDYFKNQSRRPAGLHRCLPVGPSLRSGRHRSRRPADHRFGGRRPLADRTDRARHRRVAANG
jgi:hypothetical protein